MKLFPRLFVGVRDKRKPIVVVKGQQHIPIEWIEVSEIDLGSLNRPNRKILKFRVEWSEGV